MMNGRAFAIGLAIVAVVLMVGFLSLRTQIVTTHTDGTESRNFVVGPILITQMSVADFACIAGHPCKDRASAMISGLFPRDGTPRWLAVLGGIIAPFVSLCSAGFFVCRKLHGRARIIVSLISVLIGFVLLTPIVALSGVAFHFGALAQYQHDKVSLLPILLATASSLAFLANGIWLAIRGRRTCVIA